MNTFVLILLAGARLTSVPSLYGSEMACIKAGTAWEQSSESYLGTRRFKCLPGPDLAIAEPPRVIDRMSPLPAPR